MIEVPLTQGMVALIDDSDAEAIGHRKWRVFRDNRTFYAASGGTKKLPFLLMHRVILGAVKGQLVDHINRDGLDNRRANLRFASVSLNGANRRKASGSYTSSYKGVSWHEPLKKWKAAVKFNGKKYHLGYHSTEQEAAEAYIIGARSLFGSFASQ